MVEQPDLVLEDLLLDSPQRALHLLPPSHHVGQVTHLRSNSSFFRQMAYTDSSFSICCFSLFYIKVK